MTYLHELDGWPHFHWDQQAVGELLAEVIAARAKLNERVAGLPHKTQNHLRLDALVQEIVASYTIESIAVDGAELRKCLAWNLGLPKGEPMSPGKIKAIAAVYLDALTAPEQTLSDERLQRWQATLHGGAAGWRTEDVAVVSGPVGNVHIHYTGPRPERVPAEMERFLDWLGVEDDTNPLLKSGLSHLYFVSVHPFPDGNGRLGRLIADRILAQADRSPRSYSVSFAIRQRRRKYYGMLERVQSGSMDVTDWMRWYFHTMHRAIRAGILLVDSKSV